MEIFKLHCVNNGKMLEFVDSLKLCGTYVENRSPFCPLLLTIRLKREYQCTYIPTVANAADFIIGKLSTPHLGFRIKGGRQIFYNFLLMIIFEFVNNFCH